MSPETMGQHTSLRLHRRRLQIVSLQLDDVKWAVSIVVSMFGSAVVLYIFRGKMRAQAELLARVDLELRRRRLHPEQKLGDLPGGDLSIERESGESK